MRRPHPRAWRPRARASPRLSRRRRRAPRRLAPHRHPRRLSSARAQVSLEGMAAHSMAELRQEISVQKMLDHPNIVKVFETFEDPRRQELHIIMEMCTGGALVSRMKTHRHGYGEKAAATLLEKSLSATMYCHKHGVVHRDIKLDNFIYENEAEDAELKLIDFGFASFVAGILFTFSAACVLLAARRRWQRRQQREQQREMTEAHDGTVLSGVRGMGRVRFDEQQQMMMVPEHRRVTDLVRASSAPDIAGARENAPFQ